jgi:uncharacterized protein YdaU (DUF1376 family)
VIYFKLYIGDYQRDTAALSLAEHGAYLLMLQHYYATQQPLPTERALYRLLRAETKQEREAVDAVTERFWQRVEGGLIHERADKEMEKAENKTQANRENGKLGGRPKKPKENPLGFDSVSQKKATEKLSHSHSHIPPSLRSGGARGTRLPTDWVPEVEQGQWTPLQARELPKFRDYWTAQPGQKGVKADWQATWRNWIRKAGEYAESGRHSGASPAKPLSAVERVRQACGLDDDGFPLGPDDGNLRPQVDEQLRDEADGRVVEAPFRVVAG